MTAAMTLQMRYDLSPTLARLLVLLALNQAVTMKMIRDELGETKAVKVAMHRLRRRLAEIGLVVQSRRSIGYWLEKEDRERVLEDMKPDQLELPLVGGGNGAARTA